MMGRIVIPIEGLLLPNGTVVHIHPGKDDPDVMVGSLLQGQLEIGVIEDLETLPEDGKGVIIDRISEWEYLIKTS